MVACCNIACFAMESEMYLRKRGAHIGQPCPGPQMNEVEVCPTRAVIESSQGPLARRCRECSYARNSMRTVECQRRKRAKRRAEKGASMKHHTALKKEGAWTPLAANYGTPRTPIKRCKTCLGTPHIREPGRQDEMGVPVCLPGMARCWRCWEAYAPLPELQARAVLGSSAGMAARVGGLW